MYCIEVMKYGDFDMCYTDCVLVAEKAPKKHMSHINHEFVTVMATERDDCRILESHCEEGKEPQLKVLHFVRKAFSEEVEQREYEFSFKDRSISCDHYRCDIHTNAAKYREFLKRYGFKRLQTKEVTLSAG